MALPNTFSLFLLSLFNWHWRYLAHMKKGIHVLKKVCFVENNISISKDEHPFFFFLPSRLKVKCVVVSVPLSASSLV